MKKRNVKRKNVNVSARNVKRSVNVRKKKQLKKINKTKKVMKKVKRAVQKQILTMKTTKVEQYNLGICIKNKT